MYSHDQDRLWAVLSYHTVPGEAPGADRTTLYGPSDSEDGLYRVTGKTELPVAGEQSERPEGDSRRP
jgi:hypothetical protein